MPFRPATTVIELSCRVEGHDGELVAGEADDHVDVVAGVDDGADAGDLVDLDGHRAEAGRDVDRAAARSLLVSKSAASSWAPVVIVRRAIWPTTRLGRAEGGRSCARCRP